jgi:hypothetical protein
MGDIVQNVKRVGFVVYQKFNHSTIFIYFCCYCCFEITLFNILPMPPPWHFSHEIFAETSPAFQLRLHSPPLWGLLSQRPALISFHEWNLWGMSQNQCPPPWIGVPKHHEPSSTSWMGPILGTSRFWLTSPSLKTSLRSFSRQFAGPPDEMSSTEGPSLVGLTF